MKNTFLVFSCAIFSILFSVCSYGQWLQTNGFKNASVVDLVVLNTNLFTATQVGLFRSTNKGDDWTFAGSGLQSTSVFALAVSPDGSGNLYAGVYGGGVFRSTNNGASWTAASTGLTNTKIRTLAMIGTNIFIGTEPNGVFLSTNNGKSWTTADTGLPNGVVWSIANFGTNLFAGTLGGIFRSTNNGTSWVAANTGLPNNSYYSCYVIGTSLFAATDGGVFLSTDNGTSWAAMNNGLPDTVTVMRLATSGTNVFAATETNGVFLSTNNGISWTEVNDGLTKETVWSLAVDEVNLYAGTFNGGVWKRPLSQMIPVGVEEVHNSAPFLSAHIIPNPFDQNTRIDFALVQTSLVQITVFNPLGEEIAMLTNQQYDAGTHSVMWSGEQFPSGVYFCRLQVGDRTETIKMSAR